MAERDYTWEPEQDPNYVPPQTWEPPPPPQRPDDDPYFTQPQVPGVLEPESGYGWGGVDNPAYRDRNEPDPAPAPAPAPAPTGGGGGGGGGSYGAVPPIRQGGGGGGISIPGNTLPQHILDLFNKKPEITPIQKAYQDALLSFMDRSQQTPSLADPMLAPQVEVFRAANQRNTERQRRTAVERAGPGQSGSGYLDNLINEGVQKQGFGNANFNANLLGGEMAKRREELMAGLQLASATGNAEATRELQARLAEVSAAMQQQGLNLQGQLGNADLDLRWALGTEGLNQSALRLIMGGT